MPLEKLAYGPAWEFMLQGTGREYKHTGQKVEALVSDLVQIISRGRVCCVSFCGLKFYIGSAFDWLRSGRYAVGPGGNSLCPHRSRRDHTLLIFVFPLLPQL